MGCRAETSPCGKSRSLVEKGGENMDLWLEPQTVPSEELFSGRSGEFSSVSALSMSGQDSSEGQVREHEKCWCQLAKSVIVSTCNYT